MSNELILRSRRGTKLFLATIIFSTSCNRITCSQGRHRAIEHLNLGVKAYAEGMHGRALKELQRAVQEDDSYPPAHYNLAKVYVEMERWTEAETHLIRVTTAEPENADALYYMGLCQQMLGKNDEARQSFSKSVKLNPRHHKAYYRLGTLAELEEKPKDADSYYRKAIEIDANFTKSFVKLGLLYLQHDYPDLAEQVLKTALTVHEEDGELLNALGAAYQAQQKYEQAISTFKKALQLRPDLFDAMYNLGMAYAAAEQTKLAESMLTRFTQVAKSKPNVDPEFIKAAMNKIAEINGELEVKAAAPPPK